MELSSSTTNPLVKTVEAKQIAAASRIQRFWRDGRNRLKWKKTAEGLRNRQKRNFATGVLVVMFMLQVAAWLIHWYTRIPIGNATIWVDIYLMILVWASTLPLKSTWQLKLGIVVSFLLVYIDMFVYIDIWTKNFSLWFLYFIIIFGWANGSLVNCRFTWSR